MKAEVTVFISTTKVMSTLLGAVQVELEVWDKNIPVAGPGPKEPREVPDGSVIVKVTSPSHEPLLKVNSMASPAKVDKESDPALPELKPQFARTVPFTETSTEAPFHPSP